MPDGIILHAEWHAVNLLMGIVGRGGTADNTASLAGAVERRIIPVREIAPFLSLQHGSVQ